MNDLFTSEAQRGRGIGRRLIEALYAETEAKAAQCTRVYWTTQTSTAAGRALYDKVAKHAGFIVYSHQVV